MVARRVEASAVFVLLSYRYYRDASLANPARLRIKGLVRGY
jgi:hypothetical protein